MAPIEDDIYDDMYSAIRVIIDWGHRPMNLYGFFYGRSKGPEKADKNDPKGPLLFLSMFKWHFGRLVGLNLLFVVTCLPVLTIPCAMTAMSKVLGLMLNRRICYPVYHYRHAFTDEWKRSSLVGWLFLLAVVTSLLGVWFYPRSGLSFGSILGALCLFLTIMLLLGTVYLFPMIAFTDLGVRQLINNSLLLVFLCLPYSVLVLLLDAAFLILLYMGLPYTSPIIPILGFSFLGLIGNQAAWHALRRYVFKDDAAKTCGDGNKV